MANLSKIKRDRIIAFLEQLKEQHNDDDSIRAFNEIENELRDKKYGLVWEQHSEQVDELLKENIPILTADPERRLCKNPELPWNFIIEGDNLQALYLLEKTHKGKVDCIYIDPPYNTGARDWKYNNDYVDGNDTFRHSKWLSMMEKRLSIAKHILNPETGILIVAIDDNELNTTGLLLDEVFPNHKKFCVTIVHNPNGNQGKNFGITNEFAYFVLPSGDQLLRLDNREDNPDIRPLRDVSGNDNMRTDAKNCFYPIYIDPALNKVIGFGEVCEDDFHPCGANVRNDDGTISVFPIDASGNERKWVFARQTVDSILSELHVEWNRSRQIFDIIRHKTHFTYKSVWDKKSLNANSYGSKLINEILGEKRFDYPKSLYTVVECIAACVSGNKNAIILDFFSGSGTTLHAVNLINAVDNGNRRCIMVTNNEISEKEEKSFTASGICKGDTEWEAKGIAKYVTWPRTVCSIEGHNIDGKPLKGDYGVKYDDFVQCEIQGKKCYKKTKKQIYPEYSKILKSTGFTANVKYFRCDWTPRKPEDYLLSNALSLHIKEMIELQNHIEIDYDKNVLLMNKDDIRRLILDPEKYKKIERIWINQNIILNAEEMKLIEAKQHNHIPKSFFGQELKEAAE